METIEKPKRTYQKHKTEKKITVKHYVNHNFIEYDDLGNETYPVYIQATYNGKNTRFKSKLPYSYTKDLGITPSFDTFEELENHYFLTGHNFFEEAVNRDAEIIKWLISKKIDENSGGFQITELPKMYNNNFYTLSKFVDWCLKIEISSSIYSLSKLSEEDEWVKEYGLILPIIDETSALSNLDFYIKRFPELLELKNKYSISTWLFDIYSSMIYIGDYNLRGGTLKDFFPYSYDSSLLTYGSGTIKDYFDNSFQEHFLSFYEKSSETLETVKDLDTLFSKYYKNFSSKF